MSETFGALRRGVQLCRRATVLFMLVARAAWLWLRAWLAGKGIARAPLDVRTRRYERFAADFVDYRADIFALGALLFELLKGHPLDRDVQVVSQLGSFPPKIRGLLQKLLSENPTSRYQSAVEVYSAVTS